MNRAEQIAAAVEAGYANGTYTEWNDPLAVLYDACGHDDALYSAAHATLEQRLQGRQLFQRSDPAFWAGAYVPAVKQEVAA